MADRRRRRRANSEDDSEEISSESEHGNEDVRAEQTTENKLSEKEDADKVESEFHSAEEEENEVEAKEPPPPEVQNETTEAEVVVKGSDEDDVESPTELIDEDGGGEGIAEAEEVEGDFLDGDLLDASDEDEEEEEEGCVEEERQQGDGEECSPNSAVEKELDFDEDRRNPQYIPKKGTFYEHDDRNTESPKEKEVDTTRDKKKKKLWLDEGKWGHDRYREDEQIPKSRDELIEVYGYDIRCEDGPPRARRRRRYGRGPTKYERNWKDETAYGKEHTFGMYVRRGTRGGRSRGGRFRGSSFRGNARPYRKSENEEGFKQEEHCVEDLKPVERKSTVIGSAKPNKEANLCGWESDGSAANEPAPVILSKRDFPALPAKEVVIRQSSPDRGSAFTRRKPSIPMNVPLETNSVRTQTFENSSFSNNKPIPSPPPPPPPPPTYEKPPRRGGKSPVFRGTYRGAFKRMPRGRPVRGTDRYNNVNNSFIKPSVGPRLLDKQVNRINSELDRLNLNDRNESFEAPEIINTAHKQKKYNSHKVNGSKQSSSNIVPSSKNEDSSNRPKRYSSLRQRSLPETTNYQPTQASVPPPHPPFYDAAGFQAALYASEAVAQNSQPPSSGSPPVINPPQYQTFTAAPYPESYSLRLPVNNTPRLFPQVTVPAGQQIMTPPPCITPNPSLMNYPPPPPAPPAYPPQFAYQQYPTPPPPPPPAVSQTPEMFRGGITYYYPQTQPPPVRQVPQKRPKAAIPIIPPPESEVKAVIEKKDLSQPEESQCSDADSIVDRTDSSTLQTQAPVEVES